MIIIFTRHARRRQNKRNIGSGKIRRLASSAGARRIGAHKYKVTKKLGGRQVTLIYRKDGGRRTAITAWKE